MRVRNLPFLFLYNLFLSQFSTSLCKRAGLRKLIEFSNNFIKESVHLRGVVSSECSAEFFMDDIVSRHISLPKRNGAPKTRALARASKHEF